MGADQALPKPRWATPVAAVFVLASATLAAFLLVRREGLLIVRTGLGTFVPPPDIDAFGWICLAVLAGIWMFELGGMRLPRLLLSIITALAVAGLVNVFNNGIAPLFLLLLVVWVAFTGTPRDSIVAIGLSLATFVPAYAALNASVPWAVGIVSIGLLARSVITQQRMLVQLRAAQAELADQAAAAERQRIARDIHDVVAHSLAVTMLHLTGARHILQRDPRRAEQALIQAEQLGRQSLADIRRTVGLLQNRDVTRAATGAGLAPLPTALDIRALVDEYAGAGMPVQFVATGDACQLSANVGLALYRIAQEALANVAEHASSAATDVELIVDEAKHVVHLRVRDSGGGASATSPAINEPGTGMGLPGMRRRAELLGGSLSAGPDPSAKGWLVSCSLPTSISSGHPFDG